MLDKKLDFLRMEFVTLIILAMLLMDLDTI